MYQQNKDALLIYVWFKTLDFINSAEYSSTTEVMLKYIKLRGITPEIIGYNHRTHQRKVFF